MPDCSLFDDDVNKAAAVCIDYWKSMSSYLNQQVDLLSGLLAVRTLLLRSGDTKIEALLKLK